MPTPLEKLKAEQAAALVRLRSGPGHAMLMAAQLLEQATGEQLARFVGDLSPSVAVTLAALLTEEMADDPHYVHGRAEP